MTGLSSLLVLASATKRWIPFRLSVGFTSQQAAAATVAIDLLPGEPENIVGPMKLRPVHT